MVGSSTKSKLRGIAFCFAALIAAPRVAAAADADSQPAATPPDSIEAVVERLTQLEASDASQIKAQAQLIAQQADELARTRALLDKQQRELEAARLTEADTEVIRAGRVMGAAPAEVSLVQ